MTRHKLARSRKISVWPVDRDVPEDESADPNVASTPASKKFERYPVANAPLPVGITLSDLNARGYHMVMSVNISRLGDFFRLCLKENRECERERFVHNVRVAFVQTGKTCADQPYALITLRSALTRGLEQMERIAVDYHRLHHRKGARRSISYDGLCGRPHVDEPAGVVMSLADLPSAPGAYVELQWDLDYQEVVGLGFTFERVRDDETFRAGVSGSTLRVDLRGLRVSRDASRGMPSWISRIHSSNYDTVVLNNVTPVVKDVSDEMAAESAGLSPDATGAMSASVGGLVVLSTGRVESVRHFLASRISMTREAFLARMLRGMTSSLEVSIQKKRRQIEKAEEAVLVLHVEAARERAMLRSIAAGAPAVLDRILGDVRGVSGVRDVLFQETSLVALTDDFYYGVEDYPEHAVTERDLGSRYLGRYEIRIQMDTMRVQVRNLAMGSPSQPIVTTQTDKNLACLGSYSSLFARVIGAQDYCALVASVVEFVRDAHLGDSSARTEYRKFPREMPASPHVSNYLTLVKGNGMDGVEPFLTLSGARGRAMDDDEDDD